MSTQRRILLDPNPADGGGAAATLEKPAAAAPAAAAAPKADAAPPANEPPASDDPFEIPAKPAAAAAPGGKPAAPAAKPAAGAAVDFDKMAPKELRERVKQLNQEREAFTSEKTKLEARIKELDGQGRDSSALTTRLAAIEKERDAAQAELRAARQEASPEFKEKYDKPFNLAAERAKKQITELSVVTDSETGETRPATWDDFKALYGLPTGKALAQAKALFGDASSFVIQLRQNLLDMDNARATALEEERSQFKERSAKEIADMTVKRQQVGKMWDDTNKRLSETVADYKIDPTDTEAIEAQKHALTVFDAPVDDSNQELFIQKKVLKDAHIRQQVAAYRVQKVLLKRKDEQIAKMQAQIDELKGTAPGGTQRGGGEGGGEGGGKTWEQELVETVGKA